MYYLGIDAGGTKCSARLTDASGRVIGEGLSGPAHAYMGVSNVFSAIMDAAHQAIKAAGLNTDTVTKTRAGLGIAGIGRMEAQNETLARKLPFQSACIINDGYIANMGAHSGRDGGIVSVGTGSIAIGKIGAKYVRIGGYGFPVSDEGSGAYMGLQAMRIALRAIDGRTQHSDMTRTLFAKFNNQISEIYDWTDKATATDYASLAPIIVKSSEKDDKHGRLIMQNAANHIDIMVGQLFKKGVPRCSLLGGLSTKIQHWLSKDIQGKLTKPDGDALDGALLLARQNNEGN